VRRHRIAIMRSMADLRLQEYLVGESSELRRFQWLAALAERRRRMSQHLEALGTMRLDARSGRSSFCRHRLLTSR
jgi:hypothetical protein